MKDLDFKNQQFCIILISGKAQSGKDTMADYICKNYEDYKRFAFADYLKKILLWSGWDGQKDLKGRTLLQNVGQAYREYNKNFWVEKLLSEIKTYQYSVYDTHKATNIVISDVRFVNEIEFFSEKIQETFPCIDILTIRVERKHEEENNYPSWKQDISETELDTYTNFNVKIFNNGSLEDFYDKIDVIMSNFDIFNNEGTYII